MPISAPRLSDTLTPALDLAILSTSSPMQSISNFASAQPEVSDTPDSKPEIREVLSAQYDELLFFDGLDDAIVGVSEVYGQGPVVCYDRQLCIESLINDGAMTWDDAVEYFDFNVACAFVGPLTPAILDRYLSPLGHHLVSAPDSDTVAVTPPDPQSAVLTLGSLEDVT